MLKAERAEVWMVDLGMAAKARPAVILSIPFLDHERAIYTIAPHTTAARGSRFEVPIEASWLERGAFDVQGIRGIPGSAFLRRFGVLSPTQMKQLTIVAKLWLGIG